MKKIFVLMASAAVLFAACNKMEEVNTPVDTPVETETITVVLNPVTKTSLGANGTTKWSANDAVDVIYDGNTVGTLTHKGDSEFTGELTTVGLTGEVTLHYPAGVDAVPATQTAVAGSFADDAAILEGTVDLDVLRAGEGASLSNTTALLKFSVAQAGDVTFEVGTAKYTVTGCKTGETYYACVAPASGVDFVARIGGYLSKKASNKATFKANQVANLETLPAPVASKWKVMGQPSWDYASAVTMYKEYNMAVVKNLTISGGFKFNDGSNWIGNGAVSANTVNVHVNNDKDMTIAAGTYDVYISQNTVMHENATRGFFFLVPAGTDLSTYTGFTNKFGVIGNNGDWSNDTFMSFDPRGFFVASNIAMSGSEWKIRADEAWTHSWGTGGAVTNAGNDIYYNGANSKISKGTYDIYTDFTKIWAMSAGASPVF